MGSTDTCNITVFGTSFYLFLCCALFGFITFFEVIFKCWITLRSGLALSRIPRLVSFRIFFFVKLGVFVSVSVVADTTNLIFCQVNKLFTE